jgi:pimeloyl-ACP methyl ester carboxylesterase
MNVYFLSGLAADRRMFKHIQLPSSFNAVYLDWIPALKAETLNDYAMRMAQSINLEEPFVLVGLSMGGMLAAEIARQYKPVATILISSVPSPRHLPFYFKAAGIFGLYKLVPIYAIKSITIAKRLFTAETEEDKQLLKQVIRDSDNDFIRWSINAMLHWKSNGLPASYTHIHGARDGVLPVRFTKPTHIIPRAGHLLVMNRAAEVNRILLEVLGKYEN